MIPAGSHRAALALVWCLLVGGSSGFGASSHASPLVAVPKVALSPASLSFSSQPVGSSSAAQQVTLTNSGTAALTVTQVAATGDFFQTNTCGSSVAVGASCTIAVTFAPTAAGTRGGWLSFTDYATGSVQSARLSGQATAPTVALSPGSLSFSSQPAGTSSAAQQVTLTNSGTAALTATQVAATGDFAQTNTCGSSVAVGASCTIAVTFAPTAAGARGGWLSFTDNAPGS